MRRLAIVGAAALVLVLAPRPARAFPILTIRGEVTRCTECHVGPGGGGVLSDYGRDEASDTLSRGGDGRLLHGLVTPPAWLQLGGDLRAAALTLEDPGATEGFAWAAFPMQVDLRAAATRGSITAVVTAGLRGSTRRYQAQERGPSSYVVSQEHYLMWRPDPVGPYVRAGRFFPIQGLRLPDHTLYVRRYTGTNLYEEPYALAAGYVTDAWEAHATAFVHDPVLDVGRREAGGVVDLERHADTWAIALSARVGTGDDGTRAIAGVSGRVRAPADTVVLAEADAIRDDVAGASPITQAVGLIGADTRIAQGVQLFGWYGQYQEALGFAPAVHHDVGLALELYPRAHWEVILEGRWQHVGGEDVGLQMLQLHYYL